MTACPHCENSGAWVLNALPEREADAFATHLETCEICAEEVARLQGAVDLLPRAVEPAVPPPELRTRIMAVVEHEAAVLREAVHDPVEERATARRRFSLRDWAFGMRPAFAVAMAGVILLAGVMAGALVTAGGEDPRVVAASVDQAEAPGASAELRIGDDAGDARLRVAELPAPPQGRIYQVWLKRPGSAPAPTDALFMPNREGDASVEVPGSLDGVEAVLVTDEPRGGSRVPTRTPIIAATPS